VIELNMKLSTSLLAGVVTKGLASGQIARPDGSARATVSLRGA
jgi:hypothetical protein